MNRQPASLVERAVHRIAVDSQASWINRPGKRRMRARRWKGRVGWRQEAGQRPGAVTLRRCGARGRRRSKPEGEAIWEGSEVGGKEQRTEKMGRGREIEEQRALYTRAKRRGRANPDGAGLNRKRQRTGSDST